MKRLSICSLFLLVLTGAAMADVPAQPDSNGAPELLSCSFERLDKGDSKFCTATVKACVTRSVVGIITLCQAPGSYVVTCDDDVIAHDGYIAGTLNFDAPSQDIATGLVSGYTIKKGLPVGTFPAIHVGADFLSGESFHDRPAVLQFGNDRDDVIRGTCDHTQIAPPPPAMH